MSRKNNSPSLRDKRKEEQRRADDRFTVRVLGVVLFLGLWAFLFFRFGWPTSFYAIPSGVAVIYLLAYIYPKDFTALAVLVAGGTFGLWVLSARQRPYGHLDWLALIIFGCAIAASFAVVLHLKRQNGILRIGGKAFTLIPRRGHTIFLFIACGALAAAFAASLIFGTSASSVAMIALLCYLFIAAVYYTVRLI